MPILAANRLAPKQHFCQDTKTTHPAAHAKREASPVRWFGWAGLATLLLSPVNLSLVPFDFRTYDLYFIFFLFIFAIKIITNCKFLSPGRFPLILIFLTYVSLILLLPLIGTFWFDTPLSWLLGDFRWIQVIIYVFFLTTCYPEAGRARIDHDAYLFFWLIALVQFPFLISQFLMANFGFAPSSLLVLWWESGGGGGYGIYGHHIQRYTGSFRWASELALLGSVAFFAGALRVRTSRISAIILLLLATVLIIAAGNRIMLIGIPVFGFVIVMTKLFFGRIIVQFKPTRLFLVLILFPALFLLFVQFDIGRNFEGGRLQSILDLASGEQGFYSVTGRGGDRWDRPIEESRRLYSPIGTLVNSSHALDHLPPFDSYLVFLWAQAGPLILGAYILLMTILLVNNFGGIIRNNINATIPLAITLALVLSSLTQNTMTGLPARVYLTIAVFVSCWSFASRLAMRRSGV